MLQFRAAEANGRSTSGVCTSVAMFLVVQIRYGFFLSLHGRGNFLLIISAVRARNLLHNEFDLIGKVKVATNPQKNRPKYHVRDFKYETDHVSNKRNIPAANLAKYQKIFLPCLFVFFIYSLKIRGAPNYKTPSVQTCS